MIGRIIRLYRRRKGYSINQLAVEAGVSKSYLSKIERGGSLKSVHPISEKSIRHPAGRSDGAF